MEKRCEWKIRRRKEKEEYERLKSEQILDEKKIDRLIRDKVNI